MKISLGQQIEEVQRELDQRAGVYANLVRRGLMRQSVADFHKQRMEAVLDTLLWLQKYQDRVRAAIAEEKL